MQQSLRRCGFDVGEDGVVVSGVVVAVGVTLVVGEDVEWPMLFGHCSVIFPVSPSGTQFFWFPMTLAEPSG